MAESPAPKIVPEPEETLTSAKIGMKGLMKDPDAVPASSRSEGAGTESSLASHSKNQFSNSQEAISEVRERIGVHLIEDPEVSAALEAHRQLLMGHSSDRIESTESIIERLLAKKSELLAEHSRKLANDRAAKKRAAARKKAKKKDSGVLTERNPILKGKKFDKLRESLVQKLINYLTDLLKKLEQRIAGTDLEAEQEELDELMRPKARQGKKKSRRKSKKELTGFYNLDSDDQDEEFEDILEEDLDSSEALSLEKPLESHPEEASQESIAAKEVHTQETQSAALADRVEKESGAKVSRHISENRAYKPTEERRPAPGANPETEKRMKELGLK